MIEYLRPVWLVSGLILWAGLRIALRLIRRCEYWMTGQLHKPQGDPKTEVLSLDGDLLPKMTATCKSH